MSGIAGARRAAVTPLRHVRVRAARRHPARAVLAAGLLLLGLALTGCAKATASPSIEVSTAYINVPNAAGITEAYVDIRNNGAADQLISARTSVGGAVTFRSPAAPPGGAARTVPDVAIPPRTFLRLNPDGYHMLISKPGKMVSGTEITLTLTFAKAGPVSVTATITDPQNGGNSYLGD
jgi:copper(I)-binding protein